MRAAMWLFEGDREDFWFKWLFFGAILGSLVYAFWMTVLV